MVRLRRGHRARAIARQDSALSTPYPKREQELSAPLTRWLEAQGYAVSHEVRGCDVAARKGEELVLLELKLRFNLTLVYQALERKDISPSVYVVIPLKGSRASPPNYRRMKRLLQSLEIGLMAIRYLRRETRVEVLIHPREHQRRRRRRVRAAMLREIDGRYGEFNAGGQTSAQVNLTAYRQEALRIASLLKRRGPLSPAALRGLGCGGKTQGILSANHYGWFERVRRGVYRLHPAGEEALAPYAEVLESLERRWGDAAP